MDAITQPDMTADAGVIVTVGMVSGHDRCAIVLPLGTDASLAPNGLVQDAVQSVDGNLVPALAACLSSDAFVAFVSGDGMVDGKTPFRIDYAAGAHPGGRGAGVMASQVAALIYFYRDSEHVVGTPRVRIAKNFIPGLCKDDVVGDLIVDTLATQIVPMATLLQNGMNSVAGEAGKKWYRVLAAAKLRTDPAANLITVYNYGVRGYVATQRRRLVPH